MSRTDGISILTVEKGIYEDEIMASYDNYKAIKSCDSKGIKQFCTPIAFFPKKYSDQMQNFSNIKELEPLYAEPMGNGMIEYLIKDMEAVLDTALFIRYIKRRMGKDIYALDEIVKNRGFIL